MRLQHSRALIEPLQAIENALGIAPGAQILLDNRPGVSLELKIPVIFRTQVSPVHGRQSSLEKIETGLIDSIVQPGLSMAWLPSTFKIKAALA